MQNYDILIIGSGPGGYVAAEEAAKLGNSVGVIEKTGIGGCCLNVGCIPSKTYLEYSHWLSSIDAANNSGLTVTVENIDFSSIVHRKNEIVSMLQGGIHSTFKQNSVEFIEGKAQFVGANTFDVNGEKMNGKKVLLATGGHPFVPDIPGLKSVDYSTTDTFFDMDQMPEKLVIIGGGVIAIELAFAMKNLGVDVTVMEVASDILLTVDEEARNTIKDKLQAMGIVTITNASIKNVTNESVLLTDGNQYEFGELLVATGRRQNLEIPKAMGLKLDDKSQFVSVDAYYETSESNVYAIGDLIGGYTLAHMASAEGIKAVRSMSGRPEKPVNANDVPRPLFTNPEVSEFGLSEEEAESQGYDVTVKQMPFSFNGRAIVSEETEGFVKIVSEKKYHEILGGVIVGSHATDSLHQIMTMHKVEGTADELADTVFSHPTTSELIKDTANAILK